MLVNYYHKKLNLCDLGIISNKYYKMSENSEFAIENNEKIKNLTSNWKFIAIITSFINRMVIDKSTLNTSVNVQDKKPILIESVGNPVMINSHIVDTYSINLYRQIHQSIENDLQYLRSNEQVDIPSDMTFNNVHDDTQTIIRHLLIGLTTLNEHIVNFISTNYENLYDQKLKKMIEYLLNQRDYYLSLGHTKLKRNDSS